MRWLPVALMSTVLLSAAACEHPTRDAESSTRETQSYPVSKRYWDPRYSFGSLRNWDRIYSVRKVARGEGPASAMPRNLLGTPPADIEGYMRENRVTGLLVLHDGVIRLERYAHGSDETSLFTSFSSAKSVVSTLIGRALHDGLIESVHDPIDRYVPALRDSAYSGVPIEAILQMSSGIDFWEDYDSDRSDAVVLWVETADRHATSTHDLLLTYDRDTQPYEEFNYKGADTEALGWLLKEVSGMTLAEYASEALWQPLGMEADGSWTIDGTDAAATEIAHAGLNARLRDYGRIGLLMANDGVWGDVRLLPEGWVRQATVPSSDQVREGQLYPGYPLGYQYQWWVLPGGEGVFTSEGILGQFIYVDPASSLVVVQTAAWTDWWIDRAEMEFYRLCERFAEILADS